MRCSRVAVAFLLVLGVFLFLGCDGAKTTPGPQGLADPSRDTPPGKAGTPGSSAFAGLAELARPKRLDVVTDPAFQRWLPVGEAVPTLLAIHPEGHRALVTVGYLSVLYDLQSGQELKSWTKRFASACFSGDGRRLATLGADFPGASSVSTVHRSVAVWDARTGDEICRITPSAQAENRSPWDSITIVLDVEGTRLAISQFHDSFDPSHPAGVLLFDVESGSLLTGIPLPLATGFCMTFVSNGERLVVGYSVRRTEVPGGQSRYFLRTSDLIDTQTGDLIRQLPDQATVWTSPDGRWFATGFAIVHNRRESDPANPDATALTIWDARTGESVQALKHECEFRDIAFSPDSNRILVATERGLVEWNWRLGERVHESESARTCVRVYYSPDGQRRFALTEETNDLDDQVYRLSGWMTATGAELPIADYEVSYNVIDELFFFPRGERFVKFYPGRSAYQERDILSGEVVREAPSYRGGAAGAVFMPDGDKLLVARDGIFAHGVLTNLKSGLQRQWYLLGQGRHAFVADGRLLFMYNFQYLFLIDVVTNQVVWQDLLDEPKTAAVMSHDGRHVVAATHYQDRESTRTRLVLIDTSVPWEIVVHDRSVTALSFHPDGRRFLEASGDSVSECEPTKGERIRPLFEVPGRTLRIRYSDDGKRVVACGVVGHEDSVKSINRHADGWAILWDDDAGQATPLVGHEGPVTSAAFSPDGTRCITGSLDKTVRVWETTTGRLLRTFSGHLGQVNDVAYAPKGDRIVSAAEDGVAFWNVAPFATTPLRRTPLAARFSVAEEVRVPSHMLFDAPLKPQGLVLPIPPDYQPPPIPVQRKGDWMLVELGEGKPRSTGENQGSWLSQAKSRKRYDGPLPVPESLRFGHRYMLRGKTRDGDRLVYASWIEKKVILCDEAGEILRTWDARISHEGRVALLPSLDEFVIVHQTRRESGGYRYEIVVYDIETGAPKHEFVQDDGREIRAFYVAPTGSMFVLRLDDRIVLYDYREGRILDELAVPATARGLSYHFSPDGRFVATAGPTVTSADVILHDPMTFTPRQTLTNPFRVGWFTFSPDGRRLAVGQQSNLITMWDVDAARQLWTRRGAGHWAGLPAIYSADGSRFLTRVSKDLTLLWDAENGDILCVVRGPSDTVMLHPNGKSLHLGAVAGPMIWSDK